MALQYYLAMNTDAKGRAHQDEQEPKLNGTPLVGPCAPALAYLALASTCGEVSVRSPPLLTSYSQPTPQAETMTGQAWRWEVGGPAASPTNTGNERADSRPQRRTIVSPRPTVVPSAPLAGVTSQFVAVSSTPRRRSDAATLRPPAAVAATQECHFASTPRGIVTSPRPSAEIALVCASPQQPVTTAAAPQWHTQPAVAGVAAPWRQGANSLVQPLATLARATPQRYGAVSPSRPSAPMGASSPRSPVARAVTLPVTPLLWGGAISPSRPSIRAASPLCRPAASPPCLVPALHLAGFSAPLLPGDDAVDASGLRRVSGHDLDFASRWRWTATQEAALCSPRPSLLIPPSSPRAQGFSVSPSRARPCAVSPGRTHPCPAWPSSPLQQSERSVDAMTCSTGRAVGALEEGTEDACAEFCRRGGCQTPPRLRLRPDERRNDEGPPSTKKLNQGDAAARRTARPSTTSNGTAAPSCHTASASPGIAGGAAEVRRALWV